jgi:hypothetical protein
MPSKSKSKLTFEQIELAAQFFDAAYDNPKLTFVQVAKKILPRGFGKGSSAKQLRKEAKEVFDLERSQNER